MRQFLREAQGSAVDAVYEMDAGMTEREFWTMVRQGLLLFVSAIERRYKLGKYSNTVPVESTDTESVAGISEYN